MILSVLRLAAAGCLAAVLVRPAAAQATDNSRLQRSMDVLIAAYPDYLERTDGNALVWKDGARMVIDDGQGAKTHEALLATADIKDMFFAPYAPGAASQPPAVNADPGRARNLPFFNKMYGDCLTGGVARDLVDVVWLPKKWGKPLEVTRVNGVDQKLAAVSRELDELPARFDAFLFPSAGTYVCRAIAGTDRVSAHGHGIAIDIATKQSDYWLWAKGRGGGPLAYRNRIPMEIVSIFEKHGFIWGGKWHHYDTMHFEYRPEIIGQINNINDLVGWKAA